MMLFFRNTLFVLAALFVFGKSLGQTLPVQNIGQTGSTDLKLSAGTTYAGARAICMDVDKANGNVVYVWGEPDDPANPTGDRNVYCSIFDKSMNVIVPTFRVNVNTIGDQQVPAVKVNPKDQTFVIAWSSNHNSTNSYDIYLRRYSYSGSTVTGFGSSEMLVNTDYTALRQISVRVDYDLSLNMLVVGWRDADGQDGSGSGVYARKMDLSQGTPTFIGSQWQVNVTTNDHQIFYDLVISPVTGALFVLYSNLTSTSNYDIYYRQYSRDGSGNYTGGSEVVATNTTSYNQWTPSISMNNTTGSFSIAWTSDYQDGSGRSAYFRVFNSSGTAVINETRASIPTVNNQFNVRSVWDEASGYLIHFYMYSVSGTTNVKYQIFNSSYATVGGETEATGFNTEYYDDIFYVVLNRYNRNLYLGYNLHTSFTSSSQAWTRYFTYTTNTYTWNGSTSTAWNVSTNWTPNGIPQNGDNVTIVSAPNQCRLSGYTTVYNFTMTSGSYDSYAFSLTVAGNGTFNGGSIGGFINCTGNTATFAGTTIGGGLTVNCNDIYLNGSVFNNSVNITKTGSNANNSTGGNTFNQAISITNNGQGGLTLSNSAGNTYNNTATFNQTKGVIITSSGTDYFKGNVVCNGVVDFNVASFEGTLDQTISGSGIPTITSLIVNKVSSNLIINSSFILINNNLSFSGNTQGKIVTTGSNYVSFGPFCTVSGAGPNNFISGIARTTAYPANSFVFPIGSGNIYMPLMVNNINGSVFQAQAFSNYPPDDGSFDNTVKYITPVYWNLTRVSGTANVNVTLYWNQTTPSPIFESTALVAVDNNNQWQTLGATSLSYTSTDGNVTSATPVSGGILTLGYSDPDCSYVPDLTMNWTSSAYYNGAGEKYRESRIYSDKLGRTLQIQQKDFEKDIIVAVENIYDTYGNKAIQTLPGVINEPCFDYKSNFVSYTTVGITFTPYNFTNFDQQTGGSTVGEIDYPAPVVNTQGLGRYYSTNNTEEPYVPVSSYPYYRFYSNTKVPGGVDRSTLPGNDHKMGSGHESKSFVAPVLNELDHYVALRNGQFVSGGSAGITTLAYSATKTISVDENGIEAIVFQDKAGNVLAKAISDGTVYTPLTASIAPASFYYYSYTNNYSSNAVLYILNPEDNIEAYDLTSSTNLSSSGLILTVLPGHTVQVRSREPFGINGTGAGGNFTGTLSTYTNPGLPSSVDLYVKNISSFSISGDNNASILITDASSGNTVYSGLKSGFTGLTYPGFYRVRLKSPSFATTYSSPNLTISYSFNYSNFSYNFYDNAGRLVAQVAPLSLNPVLPNGINSVSTASPAFKTIYYYNTKGLLISQIDPDKGKSDYVYRQDGKQRFSQNAKQAVSGKFSYINYDAAERVTESGEYDNSQGTLTFDTYLTYNPYNSNSIFTVLEAVDNAGGLGSTCACRTEKSMVTFDLADASIPTTPNIPSNRNQRFVDGRVSKTSGDNSTTWYSYDEMGRNEWTIQYISGLGYKTTDYVYDFNGNVLNVTYQDATTERFEHRYTYDKNLKLSQVETKAGSNGYQIDENYIYYQHGPLKRRELAVDLQGIDYTYTIQGWLKAINSPSLDNTDPGSDSYSASHAGFAPDVFGMLLEYYSSDIRSLGDYGQYNCSKGLNNSEITVNGVSDKFDGTVKAMRWQTQGHAVSGGVPQYAFEYDNKYQLKTATFGTVSRGTYNCGFMSGDDPYNTFTPNNNFTVYNINYDENGNILNKYSRNDIGGDEDKFDYNYTTSNNVRLNNQLASVQIAGTSNYYAQYQYDEIGQMKQEIKGASTNNYSYNSAGKVVSVVNDAGKTVVDFTYNEIGYRIKKTTYDLSAPAGTVSNITYYVVDLSGNTLSIYDETLAQTEIPFYGSSRIGTVYRSSSTYTYTYELTDHLGNVRATIGRTKVNGLADIEGWQDYFPHGSIMSNRQSLSPFGVRADYQGQFAEKDGETTYNAFELRMYDGRIGRWLSCDPMDQYWSPYMTMGNDPINTIDINGGTGGPGDGTPGMSGPSGYGISYNPGAVPKFIPSYMKMEDYFDEGFNRNGINYNPSSTYNGSGGSWGPTGDGISSNPAPPFNPNQPKIYFVFEEFTPEIYEHTKNALKENPSWQFLHYAGDGTQKASARRKQAMRCSGVQTCGSPLKSRDEFPYASTREGGCGAKVKCVPVGEQRIQAEALRAFYRGLKPGEMFTVVLVAKDKPQPKLAPGIETKDVPQTDPPVIPVVIPLKIVEKYIPSPVKFIIVPILFPPPDNYDRDSDGNIIQ